MQSGVVKCLKEAIKRNYSLEVTPVLSRPDGQFGDLASNVALQLAKQLGKKPRDIAENLASEIRELVEVLEVTVEGPGFINVRFHDKALLEAWKLEAEQVLRHKEVVVEYSDPNPFKMLHAGHLYTSIMGDAIANLVEAAGANVHRVNYGGDVGLHVGKSMWAIIEKLGGEHPEKLSQIPAEKRSRWMSECYVEGNNAYDENADAKAKMIVFNKQVYRLHADGDRSSDFARIYWTCREWSYTAFDEFYARLGTHFEKYYPESAVADRGLKEVTAQIGEVFDESNGAVVFAGEAFGLHTRVFINKEGLPTYEAKEVGLVFTKYDDYRFDQSIIITGNEQEQYMVVVSKAIEQFAPELADSSTHLTHGMVKMAGGIKMSSRKGNILSAHDVLDAAETANIEQNEKAEASVSLGAVKYAFLKQRMGGDIIYDPLESVSLQGNSGPYLQYAHARACSIVSKSSVQAQSFSETVSLDDHERLLVLKLTGYVEVLRDATRELLPHLICTYLYELSQVFNRFYEHARIIDDPREATRLALVQRYQKTLHHGLGLLGIDAPETL
jgi:arginyl-tRNA synthetase